MSTDAYRKVSASHLTRDAYLYVRQSSLRQVMHKYREHPAAIRLAGTSCGIGLAPGADSHN